MKKVLMISMAAVMLLFMAACGNSGSKEIEIGTQTYTDPKLMAHMVEAMVEERTDLKVNITKDISASPQIISAMDQGEIDIATLYSGEVYNNHFDDENIEYSTDPEKTLEQAQKLFKEKFNLKWYDSIGFENKYTITIDGDLAKKHDIEKISDLEPYADQLRFGSDGSWLERPNDGYRAFQETYGFEFKNARGLQIELMYEGVKNDELDVITAYSVDPQIIELGLKVLKDDKNFFPPYTASLVAKNETLKEKPEVAEVLSTLTGKIDDKTMTQLIYEVDINKRDVKEVAVEFLKEEGLLKK